jgi:signal transduction histidine kinase
VLEGPSHSQLLARERRVAYPAPTGLRGLRIAVALDMREIGAAAAQFGWDVVAALGLLGAALLAAAWVQITFGLKPLKVLQKSVLAVRSGKETRIGVLEPQEVMPLAAAVNSLLDAQAQAIASAKARAADLAHGLKTPLTVLLADAGKLRDSGAAEVAAEIEDLTLTMRRHIDRELSRVRLHIPGTLNVPQIKLEPAVAKLVRALSRTPKGEVLEWHVHIGEEAAAPIREDDFAELAGNLLDNACKWANTKVTVTAGVKDGVTIMIEDDGPGAPASSVHRLGERGLRLDQQISGSGFGLAIAHDIANAYGGCLSLGNTEPHGFRATVSFPAQDGTASAPAGKLFARKAAG